MTKEAGAELRQLLLVEDDAATRLMIGRHLRRSGFEVTAMDAAESVSAAAKYDIVVSDVHLPGMSGLDLASRLLRARPSQPIVLITGDPDEALAREALSRGPVSYLLKPFELFELDATLRQAALRLEAPAVPLGAVRSEAEARGLVPEAWLDYLDASSYAGPGHGARVAKIAARLASRLPAGAVELPADHLAAAAACHELGRLVASSADPVEVATSGARMLRDLDSPQAMIVALRHMHERWDGTGGPSGLPGWDVPTASLILSVADAVEHYIGAWRQTGAPVNEAVDRAIGLVLSQQGTVFAPLLANALRGERELLRRLYAQEDGGEPELLADEISNRADWLSTVA